MNVEEVRDEQDTDSDDDQRQRLGPLVATRQPGDDAGDRREREDRQRRMHSTHSAGSGRALRPGPESGRQSVLTWLAGGAVMVTGLL